MTSTQTLKVTYRKSKTGAWVAYGPASMIRVGVITITKADGSTKADRIESVGKPFAVGGVKMAYGYLVTANPNPNHVKTASGKVYRYADDLDRFNGNKCAICGQRGVSTFDCCGD